MKEFDPNALRVAKPCGVEWDSMTGDEQKRRCDLCELDVYNIEEMTRRQVARLLSMPDGRICGRIRRRADGTIVTRNCPKGIRDYGFRMARIAGAALSAVLAMFSITYTQTDTSPSVQEKTTVTRRITGENGIKGSVSDQVGALIPGAGIKVRRKGTDFGIEFKTEPTGEFSLSDIEPGVYELEVSADGFETKSVRSLVVNKNEVVYLAIRLTSGPVEMMGDITVAIHTNLGVRILDQNGAVLPGAALSVQNRDLEAKRLFISDVQGEIATYLDPGVYDLTITMDGFETKRIRNFVIDSDKPVQINVELKVKQIRLFGPRILTGDEDIAGSINDALGAPIPDAKIELFKVGNKNRIGKTKSDRFGAFTFKEIEPGEYRLVISATHFGTKTIESLLIKSGDTAEVDVTLDPAITTVEVGIILENPLIDFDKTDISTTVYRRP